MAETETVRDPKKDFAVGKFLLNHSIVIAFKENPADDRGHFGIVLAFTGSGHAQPYVTWTINTNPESKSYGDTFWGHYFSSIAKAGRDFENRDH